MHLLIILSFLASSLLAYNEVVCQQIRQDDDEAQKQILSILEKDPNHTQCVLKLANINLKKGFVIKGFELVARAYSLDPHAVKKDALSKVLPSALKVTQLMKQAKQNGDNESWNKVGNILFEIGIFKEAAKAYEVSLNKKEEQGKERLMYALSLQNSGQKYRAIGEYKKLLTISKDNFLANYYLGKLLRHEIYDEGEASKYLKKAYDLLHAKKEVNGSEFQKYNSDLIDELGNVLN